MLLLGLLGSVGFVAVVTGKNRELARQTERAEKREQMAIKAVERFRDAVVEDQVLKNNSALEALRKKLLKEPLAFFQSLREELQSDPDTRPEALRGWPTPRTITLTSPRRSGTFRTAFDLTSRAWRSGKNSCAIIPPKPIISRVWRRLSTAAALCFPAPATRTRQCSRTARPWRSTSGCAREPQRHPLPARPSRKPPQHREPPGRHGPSRPGDGVIRQGPGDLGAARARTRASQSFSSAWPKATTTSVSSRWRRAIRTRRWSPAARRWRPGSGCAREP